MAGRWIAVIPAYGEERTIAAVVLAVRRGMPVVVVDDGSLDRTAERARKAGAEVLRQQPNRGKGWALARGFERALARGAEWVASLDGDGQHEAEDLFRLAEAAERTGADLAVGCRARRAPMPWVRRGSNALGSLLAGWVSGRRWRDVHCGLRAFRGEALARLRARPGRFAYEVELVIEAARRGFRIEEVPVRTVYGGRPSHIRPARDAADLAGTLLRCALRPGGRNLPVARAGEAS